jgi:hypothetical protein
METIQIVSLLFTLLLFGTTGYHIAGKLRWPARMWTVAIIVISTLVAVYVGVSLRLISIYGFTIYLNWALTSFGLGAIFNILLRRKVPVVH